MFDLVFGTVPANSAGERDTITVRTRSLLGALVFLSQGVDIPPLHFKKKMARRDWPPGAPGFKIEGLFKVFHAASKPAARLSVRHRGYWFYLPDTDSESRLTFLHIAELFRLGLFDGSS